MNIKRHGKYTVQKMCKFCRMDFEAYLYNVKKGFGNYCSKICSNKAHFKKEEKSMFWKGDAVGYSGLHKWVYRQLGEPKKCEHCGTRKGRLEWANKSHKYKRILSDWMALCKKCHKEYDSI